MWKSFQPPPTDDSTLMVVWPFWPFALWEQSLRELIYYLSIVQLLNQTSRVQTVKVSSTQTKPAAAKRFEQRFKDLKEEQKLVPALTSLRRRTWELPVRLFSPTSRSLSPTSSRLLTSLSAWSKGPDASQWSLFSSNKQPDGLELLPENLHTLKHLHIDHRPTYDRLTHPQTDTPTDPQTNRPTT